MKNLIYMKKNFRNIQKHYYLNFIKLQLLHNKIIEKQLKNSII